MTVIRQTLLVSKEALNFISEFHDLPYIIFGVGSFSYRTVFSCLESSQATECETLSKGLR